MYGEAVRRLATQLFRKKSLDEVSSLETPLKRCLSTWHMVFYGVAQMAGAGIYVLVGTVIKDEAGPAAVFSFGLCALASLFTGLCYVEFSTLVPRAGSCYTFTYVTMGELPAFVIGWTMLSDLLLSIASVSKAFSSTVDALTNRAISNFTTATMPLPASTFLDTGPDWVAFGLVIAIAIVTATGAAMSMIVNAVITSVQLLVLAMIIACCFAFGSPLNWENFSPYGTGGVLKGATIAVFAFSGFELIGNAAEECKNPRRTLPLALLASLGIISVLYLSACLGLSYLVNYKLLDIGSPFVVGFAHSRSPWMQYVAAAGTLLATVASKFSTIYVIPRLLYALGSDRVIFACFATVQPRVGVPLVGLAVGSLLSATAALLINVETLASLYSLGTLLSYLMVGADLYILRHFHAQDPEARDWAPKCMRHPAVAKVSLAGFVASSLLIGVACNHAIPVGTWWSWLLTALAVVPQVLTGLALCAYRPAPASNVAYATPLMPLAPMLSMLVNGVLLTSIQPITWVRFLIWTVLGLLIYGLYGFKHSRARPKDEYTPLVGSDGTAEVPNEETKLE